MHLTYFPTERPVMDEARARAIADALGGIALARGGKRVLGPASGPVFLAATLRAAPRPTSSASSGRRSIRHSERTRPTC